MGNICFSKIQQKPSIVVPKGQQQMTQESILIKKKEQLAQIKAQKAKNQMLKIQLHQKQTQLRNVQKVLQEFKSRQQVIQKQRQKQKLMLGVLKKQNEKLIDQLGSLKLRREDEEKAASNQQISQKQLSQTIKMQQKQLNKLKKFIAQKQQIIQNLQRQRALAEQIISEYKNNIQQNEIKNASLLKNIQQLQLSVKMLQQQGNRNKTLKRNTDKDDTNYETLMKQSQELREEMREKNNSILVLRQQIDKIKSNNEKLLKQYAGKIQNLTTKCFSFQEQNKKLKQFLKLKEKEIKQKQKQIEQLRQNNIKNIEIRENQIVQYQRLSQVQGQMNYQQLFYGDLLYDQLEHKKFLAENISEKVGYPIKRTKLIFKFDPLNKANFHNYIDGKQHIVIIIKTSLSFYLAAWSEGYFLPKTISNKNGLLFSLTNKKCYQLRQKNKKAISYDDYYLIFGNSQIRLKSLEKKLFSNFAIGNAYYNNKGDKVQMFIGESDRQIEIQSYEIFQLFFQTNTRNH